MTVNIVKLGPLTNAVKDLCKQVTRLAEAYEMELAYSKGIHVKPPKADTSGPEPDVLYTDEELDTLREQLEAAGKMTPSLRKLFGEQDEES